MLRDEPKGYRKYRAVRSHFQGEIPPGYDIRTI